MLIPYVVMELSWISLAIGLAWIGWGSGRWPFPWVLLLPGVAGIVAGRGTPSAWGRRRWFDVYRWGLALGASTLGARTALAIDGLEQTGGTFFLGLVVGLILFWRGWFVGEDPPDARGVEAGFQVGAVAVLPLMAALQWNARGAGQAPAIAFFMFGLLSIGLARRGERRTQGSGPEPDWLAMAIGLGLATLVVAGALLALVSPELLQVLVEQLLWAVRALAWLVAGLFTGIGQPPSVPVDGQLPPAASPPAVSAPPLGLELPWPLLWLLERLADLMLLLLFGFGIYRLVQFGLRRMRGRMADRSLGEAPRSEAVPFSPRQWWRELLARLWAWLRPGRRSGPTLSAASSGTAHPTPEERSVREVYRSFLGAAARAGLPRARPETPNEYAAHLAARRPSVRGELAELTDVYVRARYGHERVDRRQVERMRAAAARAGAVLRDESRDGVSVRVPEKHPTGR